MADTRIFLAHIDDVCRQVPKEEISFTGEENIVSYRQEAQPPYQFSQLFINEDDQVIGPHITYSPSGNRPTLIRHAGRQRSFIAHYHEALLIHDAFFLIVDKDKVVFPNNCNDPTIAHQMETCINLSNMTHMIKKVGPQDIVEWEHYYRTPPDGITSLYLTMPHVLLGTLVGMSYFHFTYDIIPRLWIYDEWPELRQFPVLIRPMGDKFEQALADAIGIPRSQLSVIPPNATARLHFKHLIFPSGLCDRMVTEAKLSFIHSKLANGVVPRPGVPKRRIYLSRVDRPYRGVANEDDIRAFLQSYGFEIIVGASLSVREQAQLFCETEMLVGVLGGGFTNMVYMPPGAVVLEMTQRRPAIIDRGDACLLEVAAVRQLHHMVLASQWDIFDLPRGNMTTSPDFPTRSIYDLDRLKMAVETGLALLAEHPVA